MHLFVLNSHTCSSVKWKTGYEEILFFSKHAPNVNISVFKKIYETSISFCKCIEKSFVFFKQQFMVCFFYQN